MRNKTKRLLRRRLKQTAADLFLFCSVFLVIFVVNDFILNVLAFIFFYAYLIIRILLSPANLLKKAISSLPFIFILIFQLVFNVLIVFNETNTAAFNIIYRIVTALIVLISIYMVRITTYRNTKGLFFPSLEESSVISYAELIKSKEKIKSIIKSVSKDNVQDILNDLPRHNSFKYINKGSLTSEYFDIAEANLSDLHMYVIISNTGSAASELISVFTNKKYNHISIAFDKDLKTIISYNGGEKLFPPGLNMEMLKFFNKKEDSSIIVYRISCTREQKASILEKVQEINRTGSSYNLIGLVTKRSYLQNIMFCSQFVYKMLNTAGLMEINKRDTEVKPSDIVELDYYRKLQYLYEIKLN